VTGFDIVVGVILLMSGLMGLLRGATREVVTVLAFVLAIAIAIPALPLTLPLAGHFIHARWLARIMALIGGFLVVYIPVRLAGGALSSRVRASVLSQVDRLLGAMIGLARGVLVVGVLVLAIRIVTPAERLPDWYTHAAVYPLASTAGGALGALAPEVIKRAGPEMENAMGSGDDPSQPDRVGDALNVVVEKSRQ
jgi:membrane protein required for colicin V production